MKIESIRDNLVVAVGKAEKVAGKNPTLPVLAGLYLEAKDNTLSVRATNLDLGICLSVPVRVLEPGIAVVPAQTLNSFLNSLSKEKSLTLLSDAQTLTIATGLIKSSLKMLPPEDFPVIPEIKEADSFSLPAKDLVSGIKSVSYAAAVGSIKPELSSVCLTHNKDELVFVATDSFRLAEKRVKTKRIPPFTQVLIPQKNAVEVARILDGVQGEVSVTIEENQVAFRAGDLYLTSRIIDGVFPDYKQIIPKEAVSTAIVLKQDLLSSLKTALIFSDSFNQIKFHSSPKNKKFEIETKNQNVGENLLAVPAVLEGGEVSVNVNHHYFADCFPSITSDSVSISFSGDGRPIILRGVSDSTFMYLVMPMNR